MEGKVSGGTFVTWLGKNGDRILFLRLPVPITKYDAEPWGGILIAADPVNHGNFEIFEVDNLRDELSELTAKIGDKKVFWKSERNSQDRTKITQKLGKHPQYIG